MSQVLVADDHAAVRAGYKQFLEAESSITEVGEATSGNETLDMLRRKDVIAVYNRRLAEQKPATIEHG